jgi:hypothetical protein
VPDPYRRGAGLPSLRDRRPGLGRARRRSREAPSLRGNLGPLAAVVVLGLAAAAWWHLGTGAPPLASPDADSPASLPGVPPPGQPRAGAAPSASAALPPAFPPAAAAPARGAIPAGAEPRPTPAAADPETPEQALERLRRRLEALARGEGAVEESPSAQDALRELARRFPETRFEAHVFHGLFARGVGGGSILPFLSDPAIDEVAGTLTASFVPGRTSLYENLQYDLGAAVARRGGARAAHLAGEWAVSEDARVRTAAAIAAQARPPRVDVLVALARDPSGEVRRVALEMIEALLHDGEALPATFEVAILEALADAEPAVREVAMKCLPHLGARGGREAAALLRSGAHRECECDPAALVRAATAHAPSLLLAEPLPEALVGDLALAVAGSYWRVREDDDATLLRPLVPMARRLLDALLAMDWPIDDFLQDHAAKFAASLVEAGEFEVVRGFAADASLPVAIRSECIGELVTLAPPVEWEAALAAWFQAGAPAAARVRLLGQLSLGALGLRECPIDRAEAWERVLRSVGDFADDAAVAAEARRLLAARPKR